MNMVLGIATRQWESWVDCINSWQWTASLGQLPYYVVIGKDVVPAFQEIWKRTDQEIIAYMHDDVIIREHGWDARVLREFADPAVGMVGFAGATRHGRPDLYRTPYDLPQLGRFGFKSNMRTAEQHGQRFTGECDVAVLDGMVMIVRRSVLDRCGGWPMETPIGYYCYDYWLSCEVRRQGSKIRLVGVDIDHLGGKSSGFINPSSSHADAHRWLFDNSRDVLPFEVK
jgi:GT2 family glycosyltransferase